jgi:hypothetical protein
MAFEHYAWAWKQPLSAPSKLVLLSLADRADEVNREAFPSIDRLVADTGLNAKTITLAIKTLTELGLIVDTGKRVGNTQRVRIFKLNVAETTPKPESFQKRNHSKNGGLNTTKNGGLNTTKNGGQNLSLEPIIEPITKQAGKKPAIDAQAIVDLYNKTLKDCLPRVSLLTDKRRAALAGCAKLEDGFDSLDFWEAYWQQVSQSDFLTGKAGSWKASFDWLTNKTNFVKVVENNYSNRP